jgi:hypothetical protein
VTGKRTDICTRALHDYSDRETADYESNFCNSVGNSDYVRRPWRITTFVSEDSREIKPLQIPGDTDTDSESLTEPIAKCHADASA